MKQLSSKFPFLLLLFGALLYCPQLSMAAGGAGGGHGGAISAVLLSLVVILVAAKIGGDIAVRLRQPEVLGELMIGVIIGNLALVGFDKLEYLRHDSALEILAELGVIILLFEVGLETSVKEMMKVGLSSFIVAVLGVVAPFLLGYVVSAYFQPEAHTLVHVFIGATLCATSVGITARVLKDLGKIRTSESKIILGAAVIDDVLGLLILGIVTGIIQAANQGQTMEISAIAWKMFLAVGFLFAAVFLGAFVSPMLFNIATKMRSHGLLLATSLLICFGLSYLAALVGLAPIVGAFTAGLILEPVHYRDLSSRDNNAEIHKLIAPISALLVPIFFVSMGTKVDITYFADTSIIGFAVALTVVAVIGKQICSLGVLGKENDKLLVGLGMIPRGEVGLIFAGIGYSLTLAGTKVINEGTFGAVVFMVIVTTMLTPPAIIWRYRHPRHQQPQNETNEQASLANS